MARGLYTAYPQADFRDGHPWKGLTSCPLHSDPHGETFMLAASHGRTWGAMCLLQSKGTQSQEVRLALSLIYVHPLFRWL